MGSGCKSTSNSKYCASPVSSNCVIYEGDPIPILGICTGDTITEVEQVIINKLIEITNGTGIVLSSVTVDNCQYLKDRFAGKNKTIADLFQLLIDSECNLKSLIDDINKKISPTGDNFIFDLKCVTVTGEVKTETVVQGVIDVLCDLKTKVQQISDNQNNTTVINNAAGNIIKNAINSCTGIVKNGTGDQVSIELLGMVPKGIALPYFGSLSNFDASGRGLPNTEYCNYHLLNGMDGFPDWRGVVPVGAINNIPGGALNPKVDPGGDLTLNYTMGQVQGNNKVTLTKKNLPNVTISGSTSGGTISINVYQKWGRFQSSNSKFYTYGPDASGGDASPVTLTGTISPQTVTTTLTGESQPFSTVQPVIPVAWITRIR